LVPRSQTDKTVGGWRGRDKASDSLQLLLAGSAVDASCGSLKRAVVSASWCIHINDRDPEPPVESPDPVWAAG
jgi:hypothetical protein